MILIVTFLCTWQSK